MTSLRDLLNIPENVRRRGSQASTSPRTRIVGSFCRFILLRSEKHIFQSRNIAVRVGVFGGSFDPVHYGHLLAAEQCREQANLDRVLFLPSAIGPFKEQGPVAKDKDRIAMLSLALAGHEAFEISMLEIDRGGVSYTVDSLLTLTEGSPEDEFLLLMGADTLAGFANWKDPTTICSLATPLIVNRPGSGPVDLTCLEPFTSPECMQQIRDHELATRQIDISGTDIRARTGESKSIRYLMPRAVEKYIETKKLYRS